MLNQTDRSYRVPVTLYEAPSSEARDDAREYSTTFDLGADEDVRREDVATVDSYVIRYSAYRESRGRSSARLVDQGHTHYHPDENAAVAFDIRDGALTRRSSQS